MAKIDILVEGYVIKDDQGERASSTAVLVREKDLNIIVDPGIARQPLAEALQKIGIKPEEINFVFLTHYHPDHAYGAGWFPQAKILDNECIYDGDLIIKHDGFVPDTYIAIMHSPGHSEEHCSLAVPTEKGMVIIAGDVFWWAKDQQKEPDISYPDPYASNMEILAKSREKALKLADFIIPGHGRIFKVK